MKILKSKTRMRWIRDSLLMIGVLLFIILLFTTWLIRIFSKEIRELNYSVSSIIQTSIDTRLRELENISSQLEINSTSIEISKMKSNQDREAGRYYQLHNQIKSYSMANSLIRKLYVYYPNLEFVVGDKGYFKAKDYYLIENGLRDEGYSKWRSELSGIKKNGFQFRDGNLYYFAKIPYNELVQNTAVIVLQVDSSSLSSILNQSNQGVEGDASAILADENTVFVLSSEKARALFRSLPEDILLSNGMHTWDKYFCATRDSAYGNLRYVTCMERSIQMGIVYRARKVTALVLFLWIFIAIGLSLRAIYVNNQPLEMLIQRIGVEGEQNLLDWDEFKILNRVIDSSRKSKEEQEIQKQKIEAAFLTNIISAELTDNQSIFLMMQQLDIEFLYPKFQLVLWRVKEKEKKEAIEKIKRKYSDGKGAPYSVILTRYQEDLLVLYNFDSGVTSEMILKDILSFMEALHNVSTTLVAMGGVYDELSDIVRSYLQAGQTLLLHRGETGVFRYKEGFSIEKNKTKYNLNLMREFTRVLAEHNYDEADRLADELIEKYVFNEQRSYVAKSRRYALVNSMIDEITYVEQSNHFFSGEEFITKISREKEISGLKEKVHLVLGELKKQYGKSSVFQSKQVSKQALSIIQEEYRNPMIGLYSLSAELGVSNTYLSTNFKEINGVGIVQCINQLRIEKAKELLKNTRMNLKEIAAYVGFSSDISFIRVFKQYENKTPGKYKEDTK